MNALARLEQWIGRGAGIICSGSDKAPLKLNGEIGGSFNTDIHHSTQQIVGLMDAGRARGFGISFADPACRFLCVDVDIKGKEEIDGQRQPIPNSLAEQWMNATLPELAPTGETYVERTPSGGWHFVFARPAGWPGRGKVVYTFPDGSGVEVFVSTGWVRMAPSPGYDVLVDRAPAELELEDVQALVGAVASLSEAEREPAPRRHLHEAGSEESVIDWANRTLSIPELLVDAGWRLISQRGREVSLRRPGKSTGISAVYNHLGTHTLKVFSNAPECGGLSTEGTHSAYWVYCALRHGGDKTAATRELGERMRRELGIDPRAPRVDTAAFGANKEAPKPTDPWQDPIPLSDATDLPPFPVDALPGWMAAHVVATAQEIQVAADLPAMLGLAALSTVCAKKTVAWVHSGWREHVNLYLAVALPPSAGKSPAYRAMISPLTTLERELRADVAERHAEVEQKRRILEKRMKQREDVFDEEEASRIRLELLAMPLPVLPELTVQDATQEALVKSLAEQGGRLALLSPEGGVFNMMTGRYSEKASIDEYLLAFGGEDIKVNRKNAGNYDIPEAVLTIGLTVQPIVLEGLADPALRRRGLTSRFMYAVPESLVGRRNYTTQPARNEAAAAAYSEHLIALARKLLAYELPGRLDLAGEAAQMFSAWRQGIENRRGPNGDLGPLDEWTGKLEACVVRLAALLHVADTGQVSGIIDAGSMGRALRVGEYWLAHARAVHDMWGADPVLSAAKLLLAWMTEEKLDEFSVRDAMNARRKRFSRVRDLVEPLEILAERGWIRPMFDGPLSVDKRGMPSPRFAVHPSVRTHGTQPIDAARSATTERQWVASHAFHASRDSSEFFSSSVREEEKPTSERMERMGRNCPQVPPVDNSGPALAPHPSLAPEELGF